MRKKREPQSFLRPETIGHCESIELDEIDRIFLEAPGTDEVYEAVLKDLYRTQKHHCTFA